MHRAADTLADDSLMTLLRAFVRRSRWQTFFLRAMDAAILLAAGACGLMLIHQAWPLPSVVREIAFDLLVTAALARVLPAAARLPRRDMDLVAAAARLERGLPELQQRLSTWASCRMRQENTRFMDGLRGGMSEQLKDPAGVLSQCLPWSGLWKRVLVAVGLAVVMLVIQQFLHAQLQALLPPWE